MGTDRSPERARQDYVKAIYQLGRRGPVKAVDLARYLGVSRASVSKFKRLLERDRLILASDHQGDALHLTRSGMALAVRMVRRHRLLETFLHRSLGVPLEQIHAEAERIEHALSADLTERLARFLGDPTEDPHGHAIPTDRGQLTEPASFPRPLNGVAVGAQITVASIDDRDAVVVKGLAALGVLPGFAATIVRRNSRGVQFDSGERTFVLPAALAEAVWCKPA
ncbi:MAG: metal-dependent transcriptional regulator [Vulcanimicrobiaceae bacterium]